MTKEQLIFRLKKHEFYSRLHNFSSYLFICCFIGAIALFLKTGNHWSYLIYLIWAAYEVYVRLKKNRQYSFFDKYVLTFGPEDAQDSIYCFVKHDREYSDQTDKYVFITADDFEELSGSLNMNRSSFHEFNIISSVDKEEEYKVYIGGNECSFVANFSFKVFDQARLIIEQLNEGTSPIMINDYFKTHINSVFNLFVTSTCKLYKDVDELFNWVRSRVQFKRNTLIDSSFYLELSKVKVLVKTPENYKEF